MVAERIKPGCVAALAGDTNLFLGKESELESAPPDCKCAEISIMIAEK